MTTTFKQKLTRIGLGCALALGCTGAATTTTLMGEIHEPQIAYADGWDHSFYPANGIYHWTYKANGIYLTSWQYIDGAWYFFDRKGFMEENWARFSNDNWYYFGSDGAMRTGWQWIGGKWYYFNKSGVMQTGWQSIGGKWYYFDGNGAMATGWQNIYGKWYYFNSSGAMQTGWQKIAGKWYYLNKSGEMLYGWQYIGGKWYHFNNSGVMDANKWVGNYYVKSDGSMATNQKIGQYYVGADGLWDGAKINKDSLHIETNSYTIDLPASWKDKVSYTTEGDTTRVYIPGYSAHQQTAYYLFEVSASTTAPVPFTQNGYTVTILGKTQTGKTVSLASLDYINLTYSNYGNHRPDFDSETKKLYSKYIDLQTHGAITFEQVKNNPNSYVTTTYFKDFMNKEVIPAIKLRN